MPSEHAHHCRDCMKPFPQGDPRRRGLCESCKAQSRILLALSRLPGCEADTEGRLLRIDLYAAVVACGGRLFS